MKLKYLIIIYIIILTCIFGFVDINQLGIPLPGIGKLLPGDMFFIFFLILFFKRAKFNIFRKMPKYKYLFLNFFFLIILFLITIFTSISNNIGQHGILRGVRAISPVILIFLIPKYLDLNEIKDLFRKLIYLSFIASLSGIFQVFINYNIYGGKIGNMVGYGSIRLYHPSITLVVFSSILLFIDILEIDKYIKNRYMVIIIFFFNLIFITLSFARSTWGAYIISIVLIFLISKKYKLLRIVLYTLTVIFIINFTFNNVFNINISQIILQRSTKGVEDIRYQEGTFYDRILILSTRWDMVFSDAKYLGIGYNMSDKYFHILDPKRLTRDSGISNILTAFGIVGLFIYTSIYISVLYITLVKSLKKKLLNKKEIGLFMILFSFNFYYLIISFFSDTVLWPKSSVFIYISWGILLKLLMNKNEREKLNYEDSNYRTLEHSMAN